jgi:hypothetical protein
MLGLCPFQRATKNLFIYLFIMMRKFFKIMSLFIPVSVRKILNQYKTLYYTDRIIRRRGLKNCWHLRNDYHRKYWLKSLKGHARSQLIIYLQWILYLARLIFHVPTSSTLSSAFRKRKKRKQQIMIIIACI